MTTFPTRRLIFYCVKHSHIFLYYFIPFSNNFYRFVKPLYPLLLLPFYCARTSTTRMFVPSYLLSRVRKLQICFLCFLTIFVPTIRSKFNPFNFWIIMSSQLLLIYIPINSIYLREQSFD